MIQYVSQQEVVLMLSVRLPEALEEKLNTLAELGNMTKTDIVITALTFYIEEHEKKIKPYELGKDFFDEAGIGDNKLIPIFCI